MSQTKAQLIAGTPTQDVIFNDATVNSLNSGPISGTRNRIINGDMRIDQRNAGASVTPADGVITYITDRWFVFEDTDGTVSAQRSTVAPDGFSYSLLVTVTSTDSSLAATQRALIEQRVEGFNFADFAFGTASAKTVAVSFWVRSSVTGTFGGVLKNGTINRAYVFSFTVANANTWEYKTVTIPGDTSGTWETGNGVGCHLGFGLATGSSYSAAAGSWGSTDVSGVTGGVNLMATNGATFYVTGVQLEPGTVATPFERRSYGQELALCQRYYYEDAPLVGTGFGLTNIARANAIHPVEMRGAPTVTISNSVQFFNGGTTLTATGGITNYSTSKYLNLDIAISGGSTTYACSARVANTGKITVNAEL
jgi:hypothetical protein